MRPPRVIALHVASFYTLLAAIWIAGSDWLLAKITGEPFRLELAQTIKGFFFVSVSAVVLYVITYRAVTRLSVSRRALWESGEMLRAIIEASPVATLALDVDGKVRMMNPAAEQLFASPAYITVGLTHPGDHPDLYAHFQELLGRVLSGSAIKDVPMREVSAGGEFLDLRVSAAPLRDDEGAVNGVMAALVDVTDYNRAQAALRESEERFRSVVDASPAAVVALDRRGTVTLWNPAAERLFGWTAEEAIGHERPREPALQYEQYQHFFQQILAGSSLQDVTVVEVDKHGNKLSLTVSGASLYDEMGQVKGVILVFLDNGERMRAEEALRASEETLRSIFLASPAAIITLDGDRHVQLWNPAAERIFGWKAEEVVGKSHPIVPEGSRPEFDEMTDRAFEGGSVEAEVVRRRKDGTEAHVVLSTGPLRDGEGKVNGVMGVLVDVTPRKEAEEALRASEEMLSTIIGASPFSVVAVDTDLIVRVWNPAAEKTFGWTAEEVVGRPIPFVDLQDERMRAIVGQILQQGTVLDLKIASPTKSGARKAVDLSAGVVKDAEGKPRLIVGLLADAEERRRVEQLKSDFVSIVSHELRTPLTTIIGYGDLLLRLDADMKPELHSEIVSKLRVQAERMRKLVEELLEVSQMEARQTTLNVQNVDLGKLVADCVEDLSADDAHNIVLEVERRLPKVALDRDRVSRAVSNLLQNAVKYSPGGGEIRVCIVREGDSVKTMVSDQGIGISDKDQANIFGKFTQADMSSTRSYGGFGLGLYIVKAVAEAHGGSIDLESSEGQGSTFTVTLPIEQAEAPDNDVLIP